MKWCKSIIGNVKPYDYYKHIFYNKINKRHIVILMGRKGNTFRGGHILVTYTYYEGHKRLVINN